MRIENREYLKPDEYVNTLKCLEKVSTHILKSMVGRDIGLRLCILRNFISRVSECNRSLILLWTNNCIDDCWAIHRLVIDRLIHLDYIHKNDLFNVFDAWSKVQMLKISQREINDKEIMSKMNPQYKVTLKKDIAENSEDFEIAKQWIKPDAKTVLKDISYEFIYTLGYDYASNIIHPRAFEGQNYFLGLIGVKNPEFFENNISVLNNSIIIISFFLRLALISTRLKWQTKLEKCLDLILLEFPKSGTKIFIDTYDSLMTIQPNKLIIDE